MYEIRKEIEIEGSVEQVWEVLTNFSRFPEWNPVIRQVTGSLAVGQTVVIFVTGPAGERPWSVEVAKVHAERELAWKFYERTPLLYRGEHIFRMEPIDQHRTRYIDRETFQGLLVPLRRRDLGTKTKAGMVAMGAALKHRVESGVGPV